MVIRRQKIGNNSQIGEFLITGYTVLRAWAGQEGFVLSFPQVDNNLGKALKLGVAEEKVNTLFAHTYWLKF